MASTIRTTHVGDWLAPAAALCWRAVAVVLLSTAISAAADRKPSSWNKSPELKRAGYVALSAEAAARFLVGNSVLVQNSGPLDSEKNGVEVYAKIYYFLSDHTLYQCGVRPEADCFVRDWGVVNNQICLDAGSLCNEPTGITIMKPPSAAGRTKIGGKIGVYVWFSHFVYDIVKGNRTDGPWFDRRISGQPIELDRADFAKEIEDASRYSGGDKEVPISGPRAISLLIGNTFLSADAAKLAADQATDACPQEGTYYAPDGRVIRFTCDQHMWSTSITHWKLKAGLICRDGPDPADIGNFGYCKPAIVSAVFAVPGSGASDKMSVQDRESGTALTGYADNVLNFRVGRRAEPGKSTAADNQMHSPRNSD